MRATASEAVTPPAPARFSTKNCCWNASDRCSAAIRPSVSAVPPGANGAMIRTGRAGQSSALAAEGAADTISAVTRARNFTRSPGCHMSFSPRSNVAEHKMSKVETRVAIATGDPAGIGPEISLKAALDPAVQAICRPIVVGDANVIARHAQAANITARLVPIRDVADAAGPRLAVLDVPMPEIKDFVFGQNGAAFG